jgi:hypothetical protein
MAVADVAVQMGPRNTRRLTTGAIVVAAVAALGLFAARGTFIGGKHQSGQTASRHLKLIPDKLIYGMTRQQVLRRIGRPETIAGNCWQYPENLKNFVGQTVNAVRLCFESNMYSNDYMELDGKWRNPTSSRIVIAPPTS